MKFHTLQLLLTTNFALMCVGVSSTSSEVYREQETPDQRSISATTMDLELILGTNAQCASIAVRRGSSMYSFFLNGLCRVAKPTINSVATLQPNIQQPEETLYILNWMHLPSNELILVTTNSPLALVTPNGAATSTNALGDSGVLTTTTTSSPDTGGGGSDSDDDCTNGNGNNGNGNGNGNNNCNCNGNNGNGNGNNGNGNGNGNNKGC